MSVLITFFDMNPVVCEAFAHEFFEYPNVEIVHCTLEELRTHDCIVSPANSFGMMDGGLDGALSRMMPRVQDAVRERLDNTWYGEQPVGTSMIVDTGYEGFPLLAHTPTMRYPRPITDEVVYDAMRALLMAVEDYNAAIDPIAAIRTLACPGLGTASGHVLPQRAAHMMRAAYDSIYREPPYAYTRWDGDIKDQLTRIYRGGSV